MDNINLNDLFKHTITKINYSLIPDEYEGNLPTRAVQHILTELIDALGEKSSASQGLKKIITTAAKLRDSPSSHVIYVLKDAAARNGKGEMIGYLKVGCKKLYLFDETSKLHVVEPMSVLDFYVLEDRQRQGYGKLLFDYMLKDLQLDVHKIAVDGPSPKMERFLETNYNVGKLLHQSNNFAISSKFLTNLNAASGGNASGCSTSKQLGAPVGRFAASKRSSCVGSIIHGDSSGPTPTQRSGLYEATTPTPEEQLTPSTPNPAPERPTTLDVESRPKSPLEISRSTSPAGRASARRDSQVTEKGYLDVKFYHNKLW